MKSCIAKMSIGVSVSIRDSSGKLVKKIFDPIIYRGDILPCTRNRTYRTTKPMQTAVNLKVYGGENPYTEDNLELGNFLIEKIPENDKGKEKVDITFHLGRNSQLHIMVKIKSTGREEMRKIDTNIVQNDLEFFNSLFKDKM